MSVLATIYEKAIGVRVAGSSAFLALAMGMAPDAANRTGFYADTSAGAEQLVMVVGAQAGPALLRSGSNVIATALKVQDSTFQICDNSDLTKTLAFQVGTQSSGFQLTIDVGAQAANRTLSVPVLGGADTIATRGTANTFTAANAFAAITCTSLTDSGLTSGRVPFASTGGLITDSANLTFDGTGLLVLGAVNEQTLRCGSFGIQNYAVGNSWFGENTYYNGSNFIYRNNGDAGMVRWNSLAWQFQAAAAGVAGATASFVTLSWDTSSVLTVGAAAAGRINLPCTTGTTLALGSTQASTNTTTGAATIAGGLGVAGAINGGSTITATTRLVAGTAPFGFYGIETSTGFGASATSTNTNGVYVFDYRRIGNTSASGAHHARAMSGSLYGTIATGQTNSGGWTGAWTEVLRNCVVSGDTGTLALLQGININYGHFSTDGSTPTTTVVKGLALNRYASTGTIGTLYGIHIDNGSTTITPTISYGLKIENTPGATAYAIYTGTGRVYHEDIIQVAGASNLPTSVGSAMTLAGGQSGSVSGSIYIGDGSGYSFKIRTRNASTDTDRLTITDGGLMTVHAATGIALTISSTTASTNTTTGCSVFAGGVGVAGSIYAANLAASGLTSGRLPIVSTGGLLTDSANLTFGSSNTMIGLRRTPHTWGANFCGIEQQGSALAEYYAAGNIQMNWLGNSYDSGAGAFKYSEVGAAAAFRMFPLSKLFLWQTANSGAADAAQTLTTCLSLTDTALTLASGVSLILPTQTPASAAATGVAGTITWDSSFIYVATATNTWKRVAIATW